MANDAVLNTLCGQPCVTPEAKPLCDISCLHAIDADVVPSVKWNGVAYSC